MPWREQRQRLANARGAPGLLLVAVLIATRAQEYVWWRYLLTALTTYALLRGALVLAKRMLRGGPSPKPPKPGPESFGPGNYVVHLQAAGRTKIALIKELRSVNGLALKEAKSIVDSVPSSIRVDVDETAALLIKTRLERVGGTVVITKTRQDRSPGQQ